MKTYNGKNISKKAIVEVLKSKNVTEIFKLYNKIYGIKPEYLDVFSFVREFATSDRQYSCIRECIENARRKSFVMEQAHREIEFNKQNAKHIAVNYLREQLKDTKSSYAKRPVIGYTHLYFCSSVYGHRDYNKWRSLPVAGNERFCETICRLADKYFK